MISITRLLELKKDLALAHAAAGASCHELVSPDMTQAFIKLGCYTDILEDYLRIQQGSA
jgi:hypothetical protein